MTAFDVQSAYQANLDAANRRRANDMASRMDAEIIAGYRLAAPLDHRPGAINRLVPSRRRLAAVLRGFVFSLPFWFAFWMWVFW